MGDFSPVEIKDIDGLRMIRVFCSAAGAAELLQRLKTAIDESKDSSLVVVLQDVSRIDVTLSDFLLSINDTLGHVQKPFLVFDESGFFESLVDLGVTNDRLEVSKSGLEALAAAMTMVEKRRVKTGPLEKPRVLIVEDDPDSMQFLIDLLESEGKFEIRTAQSGFEGGLLVPTFRPHVILLDIMLPDVDGKEVCRLLRENTQFGNPWVIAVTALSQEKDVDEIMGSGADDYLRKPFRIETLLSKIENFIGEKRA